MSKAKLLPSEWSSIAEWCEEVGVNQSLFYAILELFKDKIDKGGKPYIGHLIRVAQNVKPQFARIAFCHDVIEDCGVDEKWLMNPDFGLTEYEIKAIRTLTRPKGATYSNYILNIKIWQIIRTAQIDKSAEDIYMDMLSDLAGYPNC